MSNITLTGILRRMDDHGLETWQLEVIEASANAKVLEGQTVTVREVTPVEVGTKTYPDEARFFTLEHAEGSFPAVDGRLIRIDGALLPHDFGGCAQTESITILALNTNLVPGGDEEA